jgi:hypothetical protein
LVPESVVLEKLCGILKGCWAEERWECRRPEVVSASECGVGAVSEAVDRVAEGPEPVVVPEKPEGAPMGGSTCWSEFWSVAGAVAGWATDGVGAEGRLLCA